MNSGEEVAQPNFLLYGAPRLWREILGHVLVENFGALRVHELGEQPDAELESLNSGDWLIWFLNSKIDLNTGLDRILSLGSMNLLLVTSDGHALVHWANKMELRQVDLSLAELLGILKFAPDKWLTNAA